MTDQDRDELGKIARTAYQSVGVSNEQPWEEIGEHRRERHRLAADAIYRAFEAWRRHKESEGRQP